MCVLLLFGFVVIVFPAFYFPAVAFHKCLIILARIIMHPKQKYVNTV